MPNSKRSASSKPRDADEPAFDVYDDVYDDIDDIDDFDAFEVDNGLRSEEQLLTELSELPALEHDGHRATLTETSEDEPSSENDGEPKKAQSVNDGDDIKPVPLKRTTIAATSPDRREIDRSDGQELTFNRAPNKETTRLKLDRHEEHQPLPPPEDVFAETAKVLGATTPPQPTANQVTDRPGEQPPPRKLGFAPTETPEKVHATKSRDKSTKSTNGLRPGSASSNGRESMASLPLSSVADAPRSIPFPDRFSTLLIAEVPRLRRFAAAVIGDEDDADLQVEATLRHAAANANDLPPDCDLIVILMTMLYRRRREALERFDPLLVPTLTKEFDQVLFQRLSGADRDEIREFATAISSLGEEDRAVLLLLALENFTYREVATIIGLPVDKVMPKIVQARERLHEALKTGSALAFGDQGSVDQGDVA